MSYQAEVKKVLIASPSDVGSERKAISNIINEWNCAHSEKEKTVGEKIKDRIKENIKIKYFTNESYSKFLK